MCGFLCGFYHLFSIYIIGLHFELTKYLRLLNLVCRLGIPSALVGFGKMVHLFDKQIIVGYKQGLS